MFRFGVHNMIWTEHFSQKDIPLLDKARNMGFEVFNIRLSRLDAFPIREVRDRAKQTGIEIVTTSALSREENLIDPDPKVRRRGVERLKRLVDVNAELGSTILGGGLYAALGYLTGRPRTEDEWKWSIEGMTDVASYAKQVKNLTLAVEVLNRFESHFLNVADEAIKYCKDVGTGNIKVHLDTFHMIHEELSFITPVQKCGKEYLGFVHVSENNRGIPGTGLVRWTDFLSALKKIGYTGPLVIESFSPDFEEFSRTVAIWRRLAASGDEIARLGLRNLRRIERSISQEE
jgi:D-psicose/D-tagatose/L-ribulose 3-epimerase